MKSQALSIVLAVVVFTVFTERVGALEDASTLGLSHEAGSRARVRKEICESKIGDAKKTCMDLLNKDLASESRSGAESACERASDRATKAQAELSKLCRDAGVQAGPTCVKKAKECSDENLSDSLGFGEDDGSLDLTDCDEIPELDNKCKLITAEDKRSYQDEAKSYREELRDARRRVDELMQEMTNVEKEASSRTGDYAKEQAKFQEARINIERQFADRISASKNAVVDGQNNLRAQEGASDAETVKELEGMRAELAAIDAKVPLITVEFRACKELATKDYKQKLSPSVRRESSSANEAFKKRRQILDDYNQALINCQLKTQSAVIENEKRRENVIASIAGRNDLRQRNFERSVAAINALKIRGDEELVRLQNDSIKALAMLRQSSQMATQEIAKASENDQKRLALLRQQIAQEQEELGKVHRQERYADFKATCVREKKGVKDPTGLPGVVVEVQSVLRLCERAKTECGGQPTDNPCGPWVTSSSAASIPTASRPPTLPKPPSASASAPATAP